MASDLMLLELLESNMKLRKQIAEQTDILRTLKRHVKIIDTYGGIHDKPVPYCDVIITLYDEDPEIEDVKEWLEENENDYQICE